MDYKKIIRLKKAAVTFTAVLMMLLMVMFVYYSVFTIIGSNAASANVSLDGKYQSIQDNLTAYQNETNFEANKVQADLQKITEASDVFSVAWNGMKALGSTLKLTLNFMASILGTFQALIPTLDFLPQIANDLIMLALLIFVVFLVLKILKGEPSL